MYSFRTILKRLLICTIGLFPRIGEAQDSCTFLFSIRQEVTFAAADNLGNNYLVSKGFVIEKLDSTGHLSARYSNNRLGPTNLVDASNPLKILVWYPDFQTVVFLDRSLTELGRLNLADAGYPAVRCLCSAADGNLWVYDEASSQVIKLSASGEKLVESQPLTLAFARSFAPKWARDDGGQAVFFSDPVQGIAVFDVYAQLDKILTFEDVLQFEVWKSRLFLLKKDSLYAEDWRGFFSQKIPLPTGFQVDGIKSWISKRTIFFQKEDTLSVYRF